MSTPADLPHGDETVKVMLARLEGKLDAAITLQGSQITSTIEDLKDHEVRLRVQEKRPTLDDHESRLRSLELTPTVSPRVLFTTCIGAIGALAAIAPIFARIYA